MYALKVHTVGDGDSGDVGTSSRSDDDLLGLGDVDDGWSVAGKSKLRTSIKFSSGNPKVETSRGVVHIFRNTSESPGNLEQLPEGRTENLCVLAVPRHMTGADFCRFAGAFISNIKEIRVVRNDAVDDRYMVLAKFDSQASADEFYRHFNGKTFSSMETEICHVLFTSDVQFTNSEVHASEPPSGLTELPSCPVCLERLDKHISGILTTVCNHSFHSSCISKWTDSSCPVCRYCQEQLDQSICTVCGARENLWICLICGFVGCGRYQAGHGINHWRETQHCYSLDLETQRVWDYVGDGYVHRLIQSKTDGKLVELPAPGSMEDAATCSGAGSACGGHGLDPEIEEAVLHSKFEAVAQEYSQLLTSQLDSQRQYFEGLLEEARQKREEAIVAAVEKATSAKLAKVQEQADRLAKEKEFLRQVNESLINNQKGYQQMLKEQQENSAQALKERDVRLAELDEQVRDLMVYIEARKVMEGSTNGAELREGSIAIPELSASSPVPKIRSSSKHSKKR